MLVFVHGPTGRSFELSASPSTLGSSESASLRIEGSGVGAAHAKLERAEGIGWLVTAIEPLWMGDVPLEAGATRLLTIGAELRVGELTLHAREVLTEPVPDLATAQLALGLVARAEAVAGGSNWSVVIVGGEPLGRLRTLPSELPLVVGRGDTADLVVDDPAASRVHLEVRAQNDGIELRHVGVGASVRIGEEKVRREAWTPWPPRKHVRFGRTVLACLPPRGRVLDEIGELSAARAPAAPPDATGPIATSIAPVESPVPVAPSRPPPSATPKEAPTSTTKPLSPWFYRAAMVVIALLAACTLVWILR